MCGGRGGRFGGPVLPEPGEPTGGLRHKSMTTLLGKPLLHYVVDYWRAFTDDFLFVVKQGKEEVVEFASSLPIRSRFVEPEALRGIADGLLQAERLVGERFIVVLGDCFLKGRLSLPSAFEAGIAVLRTGDRAALQRNYAVHLAGEHVSLLEEKPRLPTTDLCGLGFYFLPRSIFECIRRTRPSARSGEVELTDALGTLIESGTRLSALPLDGAYVNVTVPRDLDAVRALLAPGGER